jgi:hypothetical protein
MEAENLAAAQVLLEQYTDAELQEHLNEFVQQERYIMATLARDILIKRVDIRSLIPDSEIQT